MNINQTKDTTKSFGSRVIAFFVAFFMGISVLSDFSAFATDDVMNDVLQSDSILYDDAVSEVSEETEFLDNLSDLDEPGEEVTAKYIPMSEEESEKAFISLVMNVRDIEPLSASSANTFTEDDYDEMVNKALKQFNLEYVFTSPEPYENDNKHNITRNDNFIVKGRLTINTELSVQPGKMEIRIPGTLFENRDGGYCSINSVAVTEFGGIPEKKDDGSFDLSVPGLVQDSVVPFNYFIDPYTREYVFINTETLNSSSNIIEISFDKVNVFDVIDETEWHYTPTANIIYDMEKTGRLPVLHDSNNINQIIGGSNDIFTECTYTPIGSEPYTIYRRNIETTNNGDKLYTYYDIDGKPLFVQKLVSNGSEWYEIGEITDPEHTVYMAEDLMKNHGTKLDDAPDIEVVMVNPPKRLTDVEGEGLNGKVDTNVTLDEVTKSPAKDTDRGYGSQLYTKGQMSNYIDTSNLPDEVKSGTGLSNDYIYTCWEVKTKGDCTQPWSMLFEETPQVAKFDDNGNLERNADGSIKYQKVDEAIVLGVTTFSNSLKHYDSKISDNTEEINRLFQYVDRNIIDDYANYEDFWYVSDANSEMRSVFGQNDVVNKKSYYTSHYIVVAYPKEKIEFESTDENGVTTVKYPPLSNLVTVNLFSRDKNIQMVGEESTKIDIEYKEYQWGGGKNSWDSFKSSGQDKEGWLTIFDKLAEQNSQPYLGDFEFSEGYTAKYYNTCHENSGDYSYIENKYYKIVNVDDVLTAQPYGELDTDSGIQRVYGIPVVLDGSDYYYSNVSLTVSEIGVDPFEDETKLLTPEDAKQKISQTDDTLTRDWIVYGWYEGESDWEEIDLTQFGYPHEHLTIEDYVNMMNQQNGELTLNMNFSDRNLPAPYRVKVEHNSIEYQCKASFKLTTRFKLDSAKLNSQTGILRNQFYDINGNPIDPSTNSGSFRINLTNYSANTAEAYEGTTKTEDLLNIADSDNNTYISSKHVNANRYSFLDSNTLYDTQGELNTDREKSTLGKIILQENNLPDPLNDSIAEFLPLEYILGSSANNYTDRNTFTEANRHVIRDKSDVEVSLLETSSHADKLASWENDTRHGQVMMTYTLYGYEGYKLSKELEPLVKSNGAGATPMREYVYICDLLPANVNYYGDYTPIAGKLTTTKLENSANAEKVDDYVNSWDTSNLEIVETESIPDWEGTGRTMIKFKVHFKDTQGTLSDNYWYIGCGIRFMAYVSWDDYTTASEKDNIFAYVAADNHNNGNIYGRYSASDESQVYDDAGTYVPKSKSPTMDYSFFQGKSDLDEDDNSSEHNRMYGNTNEMDSVTTARTLGIKKSVKAETDKYADYTSKTSVVSGGDYIYKIHIDHTESGAAGNIVIFDRLENVSPGTWKGTLKAVDCSEIKSLFPNATPTIYYSKSEKTPTVLYKQGETYSLTGEINERVKWNIGEVNKLCTENEKWIKSDEWGTDLKDVKSVAVDFGDSVILDTKSTFNLYIKMTAPSYDENKTYTLNSSSFYFEDFVKNTEGTYTPKSDDSFEYSNSNITTVTIGQRRKLEVVKEIPDAEKLPELLKNAEFTFKVTSMQYTVSDNIKAYNETISDSDIKKEDFDYANIGYKIYKVNADGSRGDEFERGILHTTNENGEFKLKYGYMAVFDEITAFPADVNKYDFDNFLIIEKSVPYWLGKKDVKDEQNGDKKTVTFKNFYRPVVYITKDVKGVPESSNVKKEFTYKIRINERQYNTNGNYIENQDKPLSYENFNNGTYKILNKTVDKSGMDIREDGKLYWYSVNSSAGIYELPDGWNQIKDATNLYQGSGSAVKSDDEGAYFEVTFNTDITKTVAIPVYIFHEENGSDVGMLKQINSDLTVPRYSFTIEEVNADDKTEGENDWICTPLEYGGVFGEEPNTFNYTNTYKYRDILLTKKVTHAPDDLSKYAFTFKLTDKDGNPYYQYKTSTPITWTLCKMDSSGNITDVKKEGTEEKITGQLNDKGIFTVQMCGNDSNSKGDTYVIRLSHVTVNNSYTITEILDNKDINNISLPDYPADCVLASESDFTAVNASDTKVIKENALQTAMTIENDYLKRDITIKKTVAANSMPQAQYKFTMVLCPDGLETIPNNIPEFTVIDKKGNDITSSVSVVGVDNPKFGWSFAIEEGWSINFKKIGDVGDKFKLYEKIDKDYLPLTLIYDENWTDRDYTDAMEFSLPSSTDYVADVVNGKEGYIVLHKKYTGDYTEIAEKLNTYPDYKVKLKLELKDKNGKYTSVNLDDFSDSPVKISNGSTLTSVTDMTNIEITGSEVVIVNLAELTKKLTGSESPLCDYRVTETNYHEPEYDNNSKSWYVIEPENNGIWEYDNNIKSAVVVNNVIKYPDNYVIYKRIGSNGETNKPGGIISFTLRDSVGQTIQGVKCRVGYMNDDMDDVLTNDIIISDANGVINIDFSCFSGENNGWTAPDSNATRYYLKLHFEQNVKINPSENDVISITENTQETDKSWGILTGYEIYGNRDTYVETKNLENGNQWSSNADTFVNTQDTEPIEVTKTVKSSGNTLTDEDKNTVFRYTLSEMIDGSYQPAPHIIYDVYNINDDITTATPIRTDVTDFVSGDSNTGWGVFTLQHGQKAILYLPKNAYWQITEDNIGKYKLITDESGNIVHDGIEGNNNNILDNNEATARNQLAAENYNAKEIAQGFELNSTLDMVNGYDIAGDVVLVRMIYHDKDRTDSFRPGIRFAIKDSKYKDDVFYTYTVNKIPGTSYPDLETSKQFKSGLLLQTGDTDFESFKDVEVDAIYTYNNLRGDGKGNILWMSNNEVNSLKASGLLKIYNTKPNPVDNKNEYAEDNQGNTYQHMTEARNEVKIKRPFDMGWSNNAYLKGDVTIPEMILAKSTVNGKTVYKAYRVVGIGAGAATLWANNNNKDSISKNEALKSVTIPKTVTRIGERAFYNCENLATLKFNEGRTEQIQIGEKAFTKTKIKQPIQLPPVSQTNLMSLKNVAYLGENKKNLLTILKEGQQQ